jgi:hypothetical protein
MTIVSLELFSIKIAPTNQGAFLCDLATGSAEENEEPQSFSLSCLLQVFFSVALCVFSAALCGQLTFLRRDAVL